MDAKTRKAFSWALSVSLHTVAAVLIVRAGLKYMFPEGEVTTTNIEIAQGPEGVQAEVPTKNNEPKEITKGEAKPKTDSEAAAPAEYKTEAPPVFMPDKSFSDVKAADQDSEKETVDESDVAVKKIKEPPPPEIQQETKKEEEPEPSPVAEAPAAAPVPPSAAEEPPAQKEKAQETEQTNQGPVAPAQTNHQSAEISAAPQGAPSGTTTQAGPPPAYGTPGSSLDETKLAEKPGNHRPSYPWMARLKRQEGTVVIRAFVRPDGRVDLPILEKSSGNALLDQEALRTYSRWRYNPGPSGWVSKPFKFALTGN